MLTTLRTTLSMLVAVAFSLVLAGCAGAEEPRSLAGTSWQLISLRSGDDAQGTIEVPDPTKFTVEFSDEGRAFFLLDCNRGNGGYTVAPADDGMSGTLEFGPIAVTQMLCPQPSLDNQVGAALAEVRGYEFVDDKLQMNQQADGGVLIWQPGV